MAEANKKEFADNKEKKRIAVADVMPVKSAAGLSTTAAKSSGSPVRAAEGRGTSATGASKDGAVHGSRDAKRAALGDVQDESKDELRRHDAKPKGDVEEVRDILWHESATGRRAPTITQAAPSPVPPVPASTAASLANRRAPTVNYYEETSEYYGPPTAGSTTAPPRMSSRDFGSNNPYVPSLQTGNASQGHSQTALPVTNRRPVPGNASPGFAVAPDPSSE
jgi:hypothetical protein